MNSPSNYELKTIFATLGFIARSENVLALLGRAHKAASVSDLTVLLEGETGTGKQVLARAIHQLDQKRAAFPFITAHCGTIAESLAESELFGHHRGAFTGALTDRAGLFQSANRGTLFLDDINDLPAPLQPKLLDVIQRNVLRAVGSDRETPLNVRIIAAANQPLLPLVVGGRFRRDLFYRLNVVRLRLPPLRERPEDLADLIVELAFRHRTVYERIEHIEPELIRFLQGQSLTGNIRELENAVVRMLLAKDQGCSLGLRDWAAQAAEDEHQDGSFDAVAAAAQKMGQAIWLYGISYDDAVRQLDKGLLETALKSDGLTRRQLAKRLGMSERALYKKMQDHTLSAPGKSAAKLGSVDAVRTASPAA